MPATLLSVRIRGVRSYSPKSDASQLIEFMPLTLIVGANGTGKTTVIESLKFIISGEEPPHSDCRRNFIHTAKKYANFNSNAAYASIEIQFKNSSGDLCIARRDISQGGVGLSKTPTISSSYKIGANIWVNVHKQDDWNKLMPRLFGLQNQALLSHVILCHQEVNNWCMGESYGVKQIFDKIFGCEQYKKEIKYIDDEIKASKRDMAVSERDIQINGEKVQRKKAMTLEIKECETSLAKAIAGSMDLNSEISEFENKKKLTADRVTELETKTRELGSLKQRAEELRVRENHFRRSLQQILNRRKRAEEMASRIAPAKKKPALDPTASELAVVIEDLEKMSSIVGELEPSSQKDSLGELTKSTITKVDKVRLRFAPPTDGVPEEPPPEIVAVEEEDEVDKEYRLSLESDIRENVKELEALKVSIATIQQHIKDDENLNRTKQELREIEQKLIALRDKRSHLLGTKYQLEKDLGRMKNELNSYKSANINYADSLGKFVCNQLIVSDLEKLKICFQDSITNFHNQMILKINEALRSRWRQIYQGTDIEQIELVDEEITRGKDKKSYNYFMAMRKNKERMKMREKSSAGQKALASIILRMTLAELFVKDFAFIAFDEPTANLDLANVQALARSIGAYVRRRNKKGAHIQWIIITHDEQFLRALDEECSPYFYKTQMDENGYSTIAKIAYRDAEVDSQASSL